MSKSLRIAVVIAAYNEGAMIGKVVKGVPRTIQGLATLVPVVVDDGSVDQTGSEAEAAGAVVIRHPINRGQGAALKTGFDYAISRDYDIVVTYDADGQHVPHEIESLIKALVDQSVDIVLGSRFLGKAINMAPSRRFVLKLGVLFTRVLSRVRVTDTHNGFRAIRVSALKRMALYQDRMEHASEIIDQIHKQKLTFVEVPVTIEYTEYSRVKGQGNGQAIKIASKMLADKLLR